MAEVLRGICHIHSNYSHDGKLSIENIARLGRNKKIDFIAITEHAEDLTPGKMKSLVEDCERNSSEDIRIIPGLEYVCEDMHILAIGLTEILPETGLNDLIKAIADKGAVAVLAHTSAYEKIPYEKLAGLHGAEIWNPRYDRWISPTAKSVRMLEGLRRQGVALAAFSGLDLHDESDYKDLSIVLRCAKPDARGIIASLKEGRFYSTGSLMTIDSSKRFSPAHILFLSMIRFPYSAGRKIRRAANKIIRGAK